MRIIILLTLVLLSFNASANNEASCLTDIIFSESGGQKMLGIIALGNATVTRSRKMKSSICIVKGVTRKAPPKALAGYYLALAKYILSVNAQDTVSGADSWNTGTQPHSKGKKVSVIGEHVFYVMNDL